MNIIEEWIYLEINENLRVSVKVRHPDNLPDKDIETLARYTYYKMTFQDVTRKAA